MVNLTFARLCNHRELQHRTLLDTNPRHRTPLQGLFAFPGFPWTTRNEQPMFVDFSIHPCVFCRNLRPWTTSISVSRRIIAILFPQIWLAKSLRWLELQRQVGGPPATPHEPRPLDRRPRARSILSFGLVFLANVCTLDSFAQPIKHLSEAALNPKP